MEMKNKLLSVRNLSKVFAVKSRSFFGESLPLHAVSDVSFDVDKGSTLGVIGESGCGKSTLGRMIVQLYKPTSGEIYYKGKNIVDSKARERKKLSREIQMIFQDPYSSLDPRYTAFDLIKEPLVIHEPESSDREIEDKVMSLLGIVGLGMGHANRYPHEFSGGQRQRINIARALAVNPELIVCDEPVSALDVSIQAQILNLFLEIQKVFGTTFIFISHDLSVIKHVSDRIAIMYLGKIVEICKAEEIYENPLHPYSQALLSSIPKESPFEEKTRIRLEGEIPSPIGDMIGCPLAKRCPYCMEKCTKNAPDLIEIESDHKVACYLYKGE